MYYRDLRRQEVYSAIDEERDYQDDKWNYGTTDSGGKHSVAEFLVYIRDYTEEALHTLSRKSEPECNVFAGNSVRKIAGLAVACMEQNGVYHRNGDIVKNENKE